MAMNAGAPWRVRSMFAHYTFVDYATQAYQLLVIVLVLSFHNNTVPHWGWVIGAHALGVALTHLLIQAHARNSGNKVVSFFRHFYPVLFYTWFFTETGRLNRMFYTDYLDPALIRWEQAIFGFQPSVSFMERLPHLIISEIFYASYFSYYIMIAGIGLALYLRNRAQFFHYVSVVSFVFYVCYSIYIFLPVIGPRVFFREIHGYSLPEELQALAATDLYPLHLRSGVFFQLMAWIYRNFESPGAAMPSSHVAIALTTVYFSFRYLPKIRFLHAAVAFLLCLSTIYCRYHYAVDVFAGILTAAVLLPLGEMLFRKFHVELAAPPQRTERRAKVTGA